MTSWTIGTLVSVLLGGILLLGGLVSLAWAFFAARLVAQVVGEEFMLAADTGTYTVGGRAVHIREVKREGLLYLLGALAVFAYALSNESWSLAWAVGLLAALGCARISTQMVPATILVMGRSETDTLKLQARLNRDLGPFRAISLLQTRRGEDPVLLKGNCFRVGPGDDWVEAIEVLCNLLPLVVFDVRGENTEPVKEEIEIILREHLLFKTIWVMRAGGQDKIVRRAGETGDDGAAARVVFVTDNARCSRLVFRLLKQAKLAPTRQRPLGELVIYDPAAREWCLRDPLS